MEQEQIKLVELNIEKIKYYNKIHKIRTEEMKILKYIDQNKVKIYTHK